MHTNLKTLSRQYANGLLTRQDYRRAREELLDAVRHPSEDQTGVEQTTPHEQDTLRRQNPD